MAERIEAKVARVLSLRDLALNKGEGDGVEVGMRFAVLNRNGADIVDPDTGEDLGSVELPKTFVKVVQVMPHACVARTFRTWRTTGGPLWALTGGMSARPETRTETLRTDERRAVDEFDESDSYVKVGDIAVQVIGDEFTGIDEAS
jgi:hypothetical protein